MCTILSDLTSLDNKFSMAVRVKSTPMGMSEIVTLIDEVYNAIYKNLKQVDTEQLTVQRLLQKYCRVTIEELEEICSSIPNISVVDLSVVLELLPQTCSKYEVIHDFCQSYRKGCTDFDMKNLTIMKSVIDAITIQIICANDSQISP